MATVERIITPHDEEVARRLAQIYQHSKSCGGPTQVELSKDMEMTQTAISQYMRGIVPLKNADTIVRFAKALGVKPEDIDPKFSQRFGILEKSAPKELPKTPVFGIDGEELNTKLRLSTTLTNEAAYAVKLDSRYEPILGKGSKVIADPTAVMKVGKQVLVKSGDSFKIFVLADITTRQVKVKAIKGHDLIRESLTRKRFSRADIENIVPLALTAIPLKNIDSMHIILGVEYA